MVYLNREQFVFEVIFNLNCLFICEFEVVYFYKILTLSLDYMIYLFNKFPTFSFLKMKMQFFIAR